MRRFFFVFGGIAFIVACNALTGAGDLFVCEGAECAASGGTSPLAEAGRSDVVTNPVSNEGGTVIEAGPGCTGCPEACDNGLCVLYPSCRATSPKCGTESTSCCETLPVPGGTFQRQNDDDEVATVSAFSLDRYDVTVGRFRAFMASGNGTALSPPAPGAGAHPKIANSGWRAAWNSQLPNDSALLATDLNGGTFTTTADKSEQKPVTHVSWFEAFAFCAWDGGRLPTYAELNFAAAGGSEQRAYPWSVPPDNDSIDKTRGSYSCGGAPPDYSCGPSTCQGSAGIVSPPCVDAVCNDAGGTCQPGVCTGCDIEIDIRDVGSYPAGKGKYGHLDITGNVIELTLDAAPHNTDEWHPNPCNDCALLMADNPKGTGGAGEYDFLILGGDWGDDTDDLLTSHSYGVNYRQRLQALGFRCARDR